MVEDKFESPQDEALEIALTIRRKLLDGKEDIISVLRNCLVVAINLSKESDIEWIKKELEGIFDKNKIPGYRVLSCPDKATGKLKECKIPFEIKLLYDLAIKDENITYESENVTLRALDGRRIIDRVSNKCLFFLNDCISKLQYGGYIQSFFETIRNEVDKKLGFVDLTVYQELQSLYINLKSNNPTDYPKVALSCRQILKSLADRVFPAQEQKYKTRDGREWEVKENNFRNRLLCFMDKNSASDIVKSECEIMEKYFKETTEEAQDGVHKRLSHYDASMIALHTYLILSEVLNKISEEELLKS
ncbi:MAG: hypothetical protein AABW63_00230 [Nanoarchaeota archaeon]